MTPNPSCPDFERLASLPMPLTDLEAREHVRRCAVCRPEIQALEDMVGQFRGMDVPQPSFDRMSTVRGGVLFAVKRQPATPSLLRAAAIFLVFILTGTVLAAVGGRALIFRKAEVKPVREEIPAKPKVLPHQKRTIKIAEHVLEAPVPSPSPIPLPYSLPKKQPAESSARRSTEAEVAFEKAWVAMKAGDYGTAAMTYHRVRSLTGGSALAEDADFWRAVALARQNLQPNAKAALSAFLKNWPKSNRALEVAAMLGWLHVEEGSCKEALPLFQQALRSHRIEVQKSAGVGMAVCQTPEAKGHEKKFDSPK